MKLPELAERCVLSSKTMGMTGGGNRFTISADGCRMAAWPGGVGLQFWDIAAGKKLGTLGINPYLHGVGFEAPLLVAFSPDGSKAYAYSREKPFLRVLDAVKPRELWSLDTERAYPWPYFTSDSKQLVVTTGRNVVYLDAERGVEKSSHPALGTVIYHLDDVPHGPFLYFADVKQKLAQTEEGGGELPICTWRVIHRDTSREVLRIVAGAGRFPLNSHFHAVGDGRTIVQIEDRETGTCDLIAWAVDVK